MIWMRHVGPRGPSLKSGGVTNRREREKDPLVNLDQKWLNLYITAVLLVAFVCLGTGRASYGEGQREFTSAEQLFLQLLNKTRQNPSAMIKAYGMNPQAILARSPGLAPLFEEGLAPLSADDSLNTAAASHCADMLKRGYYSHRSPEGWDATARVIVEGYLPVYSDEALGILAFYNYMPPDDAARRLFGSMLKSELEKAEDIEDLGLLNPHARELGLRIMPGTMVISGNRFNVYVAVCQLGQGAAEEEMGLLHLINQAREVPGQVAQSYGIDWQEVVGVHFGLDAAIGDGLPPLLPRVLLHESARGHAADMLENQYFSRTSLDGRTYEDRIWGVGYEFFPVGEGIGRRPLCNGIDGAEAVRRVFRDWFLYELGDNQGQGGMNILNPDFRDIGIGSAMGYAPELSGICGDDIALLVADFGAGQGPQPGIMGLVYQDTDADGLYTLGEGIAGLGAYVVAREMVITQTITDRTGGFWLAVEPGDYTLVLRDSNGNLLARRYIRLADEPVNVRIGIEVQREGLTQEAY